MLTYIIKMKLLLLPLVISLFMVTSSCETSSDTGSQCETTVLGNQEKINVYVKFSLNNSKLPGDNHYLYKSTTFSINGSLTQINCGGSMGSTIPVEIELNFNLSDSAGISQGIYLDTYYPATFNNSKDYILFAAKFKAGFNDGKIYESDDIAFNSIYSEIRFDSIQSVSYIDYQLPVSVHWYQVTK